MKKIFTSDVFFFATTVITVVGGMFYAALGISFDLIDLNWGISQILYPVCVIVLYCSYKKHSKNLMKSMLGALLMAQMILNYNSIAQCNGIELAFAIILFVLSAIMLINHFVINSNHHSSPSNIRINQITSILIVTINVVWCVCLLVSNPSFERIVLDFVDIVSYASMIATIVCIESRLDAYRINRETAGWTEEKGYPEGYVHEFEKDT